MNPSMALGLSNLGMAIVFAGLAIPLIRGEVKMNHFYGIRIKKAFASDDNWYKINAYGGRCLVAWSIVLAFLGVVTFFLPLGTMDQPRESLIIAVALAPLMILIPCVAQILTYARKL